MKERTQTDSSKKDFMCDLMMQDDMMYIGLFGDEHQTMIKSGALDKLGENEVVKILMGSAFSGTLFTKDETSIR